MSIMLPEIDFEKIGQRVKQARIHRRSLERLLAVRIII